MIQIFTSKIRYFYMLVSRNSENFAELINEKSLLHQYLTEMQRLSIFGFRSYFSMRIHRGSQELILNSKILLDIDITIQFKIQSNIPTLDSVQNSIQNHLPERDPT